MRVSVVGMDNPAALLKLQEHFCLSKIGGELRVIDQSGLKQFYKKADGDLLLRRYLETLDIAHSSKDVVRDFWIDRNTLMYDSVAFSPLQTPPTTLNHWVGPVVQPSKEDCSQILDYLYEVICGGDQQSFDYLCSFISHCLLKPEEKPGICIVLIGGQGTGKGVFFQLMSSIWNRTTALISNMEDITGRFNSTLERNFIVCLDEALFVGDKKSRDRLKSMITEPTITIEQKFQPMRSIDSYHRFFAATNNEHFTHIDRDDRRFLFLRTSDSHQRDTSYFSRLVKSFSDGKTLSGFVDYLMIMDIREKPQTQEHVDQKIKSLEGFGRYWYEVLFSAKFMVTVWDDSILEETHDWDESLFKSTNFIANAYRKFDRNSDRHGSVQGAIINKQITTMCQSARQTRRQMNGEQARGFQLPSLEVAREDFEVYLGCKVSWDE